MKKVFTYIAILFAAVCTMPATAYGADDETGSVELSKKVKDNQDGTYTLTLESFVTGETVQKLVTQPCNIVLLLDNSTSMYKQNVEGTTKRIVALRDAAATFMDAIQESAVKGKVEHNLSIVEFRYGMLRSKLDLNTAFWKNNEYTFKDGTKVVNALYTLSQWTDNWDDSKGQKLGLNDWEMLGTGHETAYNTIKNVITSTDQRFNYFNQKGYNDSYTGTPSGSALKRAGELIDALSDDDKKHPTIVVFFTDGQCGYYDSWQAGSAGNNRVVAADVIHQANLLKQKPNTTVYSIGVFGSLSGVQLTDTYFYLNHVSSKYTSEVTQTWGNNDNTAFNGIDAGDKNAPDNNLVFMANSSDDLKNAFKKISEKVKEASEAYDLDEKSAVVLDVLTHMFKLPKGTDKTQINLYTCDVVTNNLSEKVKWVDTGVTTGGNKIVNKDADNNIIDDSAAGDHKEYWVKIDDNTAASMTEIQGVDDEEIYVTGFNYAKNYVGIVKEGGQIKGWHNPGKKLIIQFDIVTDPANTGGLTLVTNEEHSGIYKRDEKTGELIRVETYEQPVVQLPYLRIIKQGLEVGESATFTVVKTLDAEGKEIDYTDQKYTAKVIITRKTEAEAEPYATLKLLHSGYYRVTESSWAWTYTPNGSTEQTKHLTTVKSSDETPNNIEYVFSNTKKKEGTSGYIEGAEDYIRNNLTTGKKIQPTVPSGGTEDDGSIN